MSNEAGGPKHFLFMRNYPRGGDWGGMEVLLFDLLARIDYSRCRVTLAVSPGSKIIFEQKLADKKWPIHLLEFPSPVRVKAWKRFGDMRRFLNELKPHTVVFFQGWYLDFRLAEVMAAYFHCRGDVYFHDNLGAPPPLEKTSRKHFGILPGMGLWWYVQGFCIRMRAYFCKSDLVVSEGIKELWKTLWGYPDDKIKVAYHGINVEKFSPSADIRSRMREANKLDPSVKVIVVTARFTDQKRLDRLINAFGRLAEEFKDVHLLLAGSGPLENELRRLADGQRSRDRIKFLGMISNVPDYLKMSDFFVLSSDNEGLSLALMEAMAAELVCVSTDCTGSREVIEDGVTGFLVEKSEESLHQGMRRAVLLGAQERSRMKKNARNLITQKFEIDRNSKQVLTTLGVPCHP